SALLEVFAVDDDVGKGLIRHHHTRVPRGGNQQPLANQEIEHRRSQQLVVHRQGVDIREALENLLLLHLDAPQHLQLGDFIAVHGGHLIHRGTGYEEGLYTPEREGNNDDGDKDGGGKAADIVPEILQHCVALWIPQLQKGRTEMRPVETTRKAVSSQRLSAPC